MDLLSEQGENAIITVSDHVGGDEKAAAAAIEQNISKTITDERPTHPDYYRKMSESLAHLISKSRDEATDYAEYLKELVALARKVRAGSEGEYPPEIADSAARRALYDNLGQNESLALEVNEAVEKNLKAKWLGNTFKENRVRYAIQEALEGSREDPEKTFDIVRSQPEYRR